MHIEILNANGPTSNDSSEKMVASAGTVAGVKVGCFPDLYTALAGNAPDQVITL